MSDGSKYSDACFVQIRTPELPLAGALLSLASDWSVLRKFFQASPSVNERESSSQLSVVSLNASVP